MFFRLCFCAVFCVFLNRWKQWKSLKTLRRAAKTVCAGNHKNRSRARFRMDLEVIFGVQLATNVVFLLNKWVQENKLKKGIPKSETGGDGHVPGLPDSPPKVKDCLSNKQQLNKKQQQFNKNTNNCRVVASARLLLCVFLVRFLLQTDVVSVSCSILNVVAELVIWHALSKARRI